jgi:uncharacterized protein with GYD domain
LWWERNDPLQLLSGRKEETVMPTYISLANWTDQGRRDVKQSLQRADRTDQLAQKYGCNLHLYWTVGPYDFVAITEAPDEESARALTLEVDSGGAVKSTVLRAYDREEMSSILERLG